VSAATSDPAKAGKGAENSPSVPVSISVPTLNIANILTLSRLVLVPLFVGALFTQDGTSTLWRLIATGLFALASVTDQVDGWVARRYGLVTDFGKIADPIADKALTGAALIGLSLLGELAWWVTVVIAVREILVTALRFWVIRFGVISASRGGKAKTLTQMLAIGAFLLPIAGTAWTMVERVSMGLALLLTVVTGFDYLFRALRLRIASKTETAQ